MGELLLVQRVRDELGARPDRERDALEMAEQQRTRGPFARGDGERLRRGRSRRDTALAGAAAARGGRYDERQRCRKEKASASHRGLG
jgi:hypothetical protein